MHIHQDGINSVIGRIGLGIGKETERSNLFAKIALAHEFGGKVKSIFSAKTNQRAGQEVDLKDSWVDVEVGGRLAGEREYVPLTEPTRETLELMFPASGDRRRHPLQLLIWTE